MPATKQFPRVSIVIPCKAISAFAFESIEHCRALDYPDFEILVLPDEPLSEPEIEGVTVVPTGPMGPSPKRDIAATKATGEILAFIDDDAYPRVDWLMKAVPLFADQDVAAVGGPAVTPDSDGYLEAASGAVYESLLGGGPHAYRYTPRDSRNVDDYPTCNLLVRKDDFNRVGGFGTEYWPGEDTKFCLTLTVILGKTIRYDPEVLVYHHRRNVFRGHLKQITSYAVHRGFFVKRFPETSRRPSYFIPTIATFGMILGAFALLVPWLSAFYLAGVAIYVSLVAISSALVSWRKPWLLPTVAVGTIVSHFAYGTWFLKGLLSRRLAQ